MLSQGSAILVDITDHSREPEKGRTGQGHGRPGAEGAVRVRDGHGAGRAPQLVLPQSGANAVSNARGCLPSRHALSEKKK